MTSQRTPQLDDTGFVERAYQEVLGRHADPEGLAAYLEKLSSGVSRAQIVAELRNSEEGRRRAAQLGHPVMAATAGHGRPADPGLMQLLSSQSDARFIEAAYQAVLGRGADSTGRAAYLQALQAGSSRMDVLEALLLSPEGQRAGRPLTDLRQALSRRWLARWRLARPAMRLLRRIARRLNVRPHLGTALRSSTSTPKPRSKPAEGPDPLRPKGRARTGLRPGPRAHAMTQTDPTHSSAIAAHADAAASVAVASDQDARHLHVLAITGPVMQGWSAGESQSLAFSMALGDVVLGKVVPDLDRPDLALAHALQIEQVGFSVGVGGLLQFAQLALRCHELKITQQVDAGACVTLDLRLHAAEALTFAPMRALVRPLPQPVGQIRAFRFVAPLEAAVLFEADEVSDQPPATRFMDFYQEDTSGKLVRVGRFAVELGGQLHELTLALKDASRPLLLVVTDEARRLITTDCYPLPTLFSRRLAPLIDYQVALENGAAPFAVAAKLARSFLDRHIEAAPLPPHMPRPASTLILAYSQAGTSTPVEDRLQPFVGLAATVAYLDELGLVTEAGGSAMPLAEVLRSSRAEHVLMINVEDTLRPDFWSVLATHHHGIGPQTSLIYWHSIWNEPGQRLQVAKLPPLLSPAFREHRLPDNRAFLVTKEVLRAAIESKSGLLTSGSLVLEHLFDFVPAQATAEAPVAMQVVRSLPKPQQVQRLQDEQIALSLPPRISAEMGTGSTPSVSAVINFRDGVADTNRTLAALHLQQGIDRLEIILVNNGSLPTSVQDILAHAQGLFGIENVRLLDYPHRFNHSAQCNSAATEARHEVLLMLSNDATFVTRSAVARAARVAMVPWVGTCGFRVVGNDGGKRRLQSVGLALSPRRHLFAGGSPIGRGLVPNFALECTFEVHGNTFAGVLVRKSVYKELDGLDSEAFPTNYNDVDFCFRASNAGYRHVVVGSEILEHTGRGSREFDQDLPVDPRLVERAPRLDQLCRLGFHQL